VIVGGKRKDVKVTTMAVASHITAAYWFTGLDVIRQPCGHLRQVADRELRGHPLV